MKKSNDRVIVRNIHEEVYRNLKTNLKSSPGKYQIPNERETEFWRFWRKKEQNLHSKMLFFNCRSVLEYCNTRM